MVPALSGGHVQDSEVEAFYKRGLLPEFIPAFVIASEMYGFQTASIQPILSKKFAIKIARSYVYIVNSFPAWLISAEKTGGNHRSPP